MAVAAKGDELPCVALECGVAGVWRLVDIGRTRACLRDISRSVVGILVDKATLVILPSRTKLDEMPAGV